MVNKVLEHNERLLNKKLRGGVRLTYLIDELGGDAQT